MADEEDPDKAEWLVAPAGAGEVRLLVELGEGVELTDEQAEALENLIEALEGAEVEGFSMGGGPNLKVGLLGGMSPGAFTSSTCKALACSKHSCGVHSCDDYVSVISRYGFA